MDGMEDRRMGCMTGFLQLFDRHHILASKRLYTTKRLPPFSKVNDTSETQNIIASEVIKGNPAKVVAIPSPEQSKQSPNSSELHAVFIPTDTPPKSPLPLPIFEVKDGGRSTWKIRKEAPRLSLDSRATVDAKGSLHPKEIQINASTMSANHSKDGVVSDDDKQRRCPSVIAKLMGLEALPQSSSETIQKAELRRSASESRVSRDLFQSHFNEGNNFEFKEPTHLQSNIPNFVMAKNVRSRHRGCVESGSGLKKSEMPSASSRGLSSTSRKSPQYRKSFYDTADIFPEPKQTVPLQGEINKKLRIRGLDEPSKDLETLKQILEALQLKGLLHNKKPSEQINHLNVIYDFPSFSSEESQIVVMKPSRSISPVNRKNRNDTPPSNLGSRVGFSQKINHSNESLPSVSPYRERPTDRNAHSPVRTAGSTSPNRRDSSMRHSSSVKKSKLLNVEPQRRASESIEYQRPSPVQSPKIMSGRNNSLEQSFTKRSWNKKPLAQVHHLKEKITTFIAEDESSSISESSLTTPFQTDGERSNTKEYNEDTNLLERCDKLIHSIAEMTATDLQPSPVSVLDSSFYKEESPSPSPIRKRSIEFLGDFDKEIPMAEISLVQSKSMDATVDCDVSYITDILRASHYLPEDSDIFLLLEKQQFLKGRVTSEESRLQRKLIFDTITEILDRNGQLPPWKVYSLSNSIAAQSSVEKILSEFQRIQERGSSDDLFEIICEALKKDLAQDAVNGWGDCPIEMSETVLDMERLIYKDLMGETIRDLASFACKSSVTATSRRKLVFSTEAN